VQLHGNESAEFCKQLKRHYEEQRDEVILPNSTYNNSIEIIKVFSIKDDFDFSVLKPYEDVCDYYLFDTKGKLPGGNGFTFNWEALKDYPSSKPYFLSGGIGLEEIDKVLSFLRRQESKNCYAIDINSKFELKPGLKDIEKLKEFLNNVITRSPNVNRDDEVIS
jgi:phosphoribosylanthranilate isomerase